MYDGRSNTIFVNQTMILPMYHFGLRPLLPGSSLSEVDRFCSLQMRQQFQSFKFEAGHTWLPQCLWLFRKAFELDQALPLP